LLADENDARDERNVRRVLFPVLPVQDRPPADEHPRQSLSLAAPRPTTHLSLSSLMVVMTTLLGCTPMGAVAPLDLSRCTRSTWIIHFFRYTCVTLPSRPLNFPRTIRTSSSLRIGIERVYRIRDVSRCARSGKKHRHVVFCAQVLGQGRRHDLAAH
jgi:hypothetical protein